MKHPTAILDVSIDHGSVLYSEAFVLKTMVQLLLFIPCWVIQIDSCIHGLWEAFVHGSRGHTPNF